MSLVLLQNITAMAAGRKTRFNGSGGTEPYTYTVLPNGAGGTIDPATGLYTAPAIAPADPTKMSDTIQVTDSASATATGVIKVLDALGLVCEIIQKEMGLPDGRVYIFDQKINSPTDSDLFIAVGVLQSKPFGSSTSYDTSGEDMLEVQSVNVLDILSINIISRSTEALRRKGEVLLALASTYAEQQQEANSFTIGKLPRGGQFVNLSEIDGAAIPYRFNISVNIMYFISKVKTVPYFDNFTNPPSVTTEP